LAADAGYINTVDKIHNKTEYTLEQTTHNKLLLAHYYHSDTVKWQVTLCDPIMATVLL